MYFKTKLSNQVRNLLAERRSRVRAATLLTLESLKYKKMKITNAQGNFAPFVSRLIMKKILAIVIIVLNGYAPFVKESAFALGA